MEAGRVYKLFFILINCSLQKQGLFKFSCYLILAKGIRDSFHSKNRVYAVKKMRADVGWMPAFETHIFSLNSIIWVQTCYVVCTQMPFSACGGHNTSSKIYWPRRFPFQQHLAQTAAVLPFLFVKAEVFAFSGGVCT